MNIDWETNRLIIKRTKEDDFEELAPMLLDYSITKFLQKNYIQVHSIEIAKTFLLEFLYNGIISFTIKIKKTNEVIGQIGYPYSSDSLTIFYWIGAKYQGKGYATEASFTLTNYIFKKSFKKKFEIPVHIENTKSIKLANKIRDFLLKTNPEWNILDKNDESETYEIIDINDDSVKVKFEFKREAKDDEYQFFDISMFPDEFLIIGKRVPINLKFIVISKN